MNSNSVTRVTIPSELRVEGTTYSSKVLRIRATAPISVVAINQEQNSCGGFTILPVQGLQNEYMSIQNWPERVGYRRFSQIAIVAVEQVTVNVQFNTGKGIRVPYEGRNYPESGVLTVDIAPYDVVTHGQRLRMQPIATLPESTFSR